MDEELKQALERLPRIDRVPRPSLIDMDREELFQREKAVYTVEAMVEALKEKKPIYEHGPATVMFNGMVDCFVYFISCRNFVKVGYSSTPDWRIDQIKTGNPYAVSIIGVLPGDIQHEAQLHRALHKRRHRHEWFNMNDDFEHIIAKHTFMYHVP
jgi:hypothetical protein